MKKILIDIYEFVRMQYHYMRRRLIAPAIPKNHDGKVYINVGCGLASGKEFINIDVLGLSNIHFVQDVTDLRNFDDNTADMIYASHVVEHLPREKLMSTLREWKRVLKKGGIFRISVPDFDQLIKIYHGNHDDVLSIRDQVLGQNPPYNNHYTLWNLKQGEKIFSEAGFTDVCRWDPATASNHEFKDRATRAIKAGDVEIPISLNIQGKKA